MRYQDIVHQKNQTALQAALRYYKTFGLAASLGLGARIGRVTVRGQFIASVCKKHGVLYEFVTDV